MQTQAYFDCPDHGYPSSSNNYENFIGTMPGHIRSTFNAATDALKGCCMDGVNITTLNKRELIPYFCSENGHGIFQSSLMNQCDAIQFQTCTIVYSSSFSNYLFSLTTSSNYIPTTIRNYPMSSTPWLDQTHWYSSFTTRPPPTSSWLSSFSSHSQPYLYHSTMMIPHGMHPWLTTGDSMITTVRPSWYQSWTTGPFFSTFSWSHPGDRTTMSPGSVTWSSASSLSSFSRRSWQSSSDTQRYQSRTTTPSSWSSHPTVSTNLGINQENQLLAQFMAYYTYHSSSLNDLFNSVIKCPDSNLLTGFVNEFTKRTSMCTNYFGIELENSVLVIIFQALGFPFHNEQDPFLNQMYGFFWSII